MMTHGGAREGAGRKKREPYEQFGCRMKIENKRFLQKRAKETGLTVTEVLEMIIETFMDENK